MEGILHSLVPTHSFLGSIFRYGKWTPGTYFIMIYGPPGDPRGPVFAMRNGPRVHILGGSIYHLTPEV